jgi:2-phospho-L-lactate transferase/gluconeogenesis factor (CofD/UPF0052 family)
MTARVDRGSKLQVVLFSGGRGSSVISRGLIGNPRFSLTVAVNGYDDGASTGEIRRFLGDSLGPSDFRKNASRLARELHSCEGALLDLLDLRFPKASPAAEAADVFRIARGAAAARTTFGGTVGSTLGMLGPATRDRIAGRLERFEAELTSAGRPFDFSDCSVGNLVFAGGFLACGRRFNAAVANYCALVGLPDGLVENVTDGTNAFLVALDLNGRILGSEAEIVDAKRRNRISDIFLIDSPLGDVERARLGSLPPPAIAELLEGRSVHLPVNPRLAERIAVADLIVYSPGTQHSSLFPSYLTRGLSAAIARNITAIKLLVTNIQTDAEIAGGSAVDVIERAVHYLKGKGRLGTPTPCLITHFLINDPGAQDPPAPYLPLGRLEDLEDPRLIRIGNYEDGATGCHDAAKILTPFIESLLADQRVPKVAVWLYGAESADKLCQSLLELVRGGIERVPVAPTVFYSRAESLDRDFIASLPFAVRNLGEGGEAAGQLFRRAILEEAYDYAVLFESSGMYRGEEVPSLVSPLRFGRLDAVWGSRRLSVRDIHESYRLRYRHNRLLGAISYVGSHLLSLTYLLLYGRYVSDTLSGVRAVRARFLADDRVALDHRCANQYLLSALLRQKADVLETPVRFFALSPERVRRTNVLDGLHAICAILAGRFARGRAPDGALAAGTPAGGIHVAGTDRPVSRCVE